VLPSFESTGVDTVVFAMNQDLYAPAVGVASVLRKAGQSVDVVLEAKKLKWVFKHADRIGAKYCVVVGADEYLNGEVAIKDLSGGAQKSVKIDDLSNWVSDEQ
jgi:histidyl-tRNA synthetase